MAVWTFTLTAVYAASSGSLVRTVFKQSGTVTRLDGSAVPPITQAGSVVPRVTTDGNGSAQFTVDRTAWGTSAPEVLVTFGTHSVQVKADEYGDYLASVANGASATSIDSHLGGDATNLVPTVAGKLDADVAAATYAPTTALATKAPYGAARPHVGSNLASALDMGYGDLVVAVAGDSTGNDTFEWVRKLATYFVDRYPADLGVTYRLWDDATQTYPSVTTLRSGTAPTGGPTTLLHDTFTRTASDLKGTTPDVGPAWGGATNAAGDWSIDGTKAVRTSDSSSSQQAVDLGQQGDVTLTLTGVTMSTIGDTANREFNAIVKQVDATNYLRMRLQVAASTGAVAWHLFKVAAGSSTTLATGTANPITANTASVTFDCQVSVIGDQFQAIIGANTVTATLSAGDLTTYGPATTVGFTSSAGTLVGMSISEVTAVVDVTPTPGHSVAIYNGSMPGSTLAYQQSRIADMYPVEPDLLFISPGHNYNATNATDYLAAVDSFVTDMRATYPDLPVVVMSQNPEFTDGGRSASYVSAHAARFAALRPHAAAQGWGYVPVFEAFVSKPSGGRAWVMADGIHPAYDPTGVNDGGDLWVAQVTNYLNAMSYRTDLPTS